jgi:hypothetical protein
METKFYPVADHELKEWRVYLEKAKQALLNGSYLYIKIERMEQSMSLIGSTREPLPFEFRLGISKGDLVKELGITWTIDYALPQAWVNHVEEITGENPCPHMVWSYGQGSGYDGEPLPITDKGKAILWDYRKATK